MITTTATTGMRGHNTKQYMALLHWQYVASCRTEITVCQRQYEAYTDSHALASVRGVHEVIRQYEAHTTALLRLRSSRRYSGPPRTPVLV
jgi:hypothetical protein